MTRTMQILVVDDEETICEALSAWLTKEGYRVCTANSGQQALDLLAELWFDLYLVDIKMPGMDGLELLKKIRELQPDATGANLGEQRMEHHPGRQTIGYRSRDLDPQDEALRPETSRQAVRLWKP